MELQNFGWTVRVILVRGRNLCIGVTEQPRDCLLWIDEEACNCSIFSRFCEVFFPGYLYLVLGAWNPSVTIKM